VGNLNHINTDSVDGNRNVNEENARGQDLEGGEQEGREKPETKVKSKVVLLSSLPHVDPTPHFTCMARSVGFGK
jgi:hypothetical protein